MQSCVRCVALLVCFLLRQFQANETNPGQLMLSALLDIPGMLFIAIYTHLLVDVTKLVFKERKSYQWFKGIVWTVVCLVFSLWLVTVVLMGKLSMLQTDDRNAILFSKMRDGEFAVLTLSVAVLAFMLIFLVNSKRNIEIVREFGVNKGTLVLVMVTVAASFFTRGIFMVVLFFLNDQYRYPLLFPHSACGRRSTD